MSILTTVSQQIVDAIETKRKAGSFTVSEFICDWDFEGREDDAELTDNRVHVRVVVPRKWERAERIDRGNSLEYIGVWDIDVRQKLGIVSQNSESTLERDRLADLVALVEEIHAMMLTDQPDDGTYYLQWLAGDDDSPKQSEILHSYSIHHLRKHRQFYGVCREVFQVTQ